MVAKTSLPALLAAQLVLSCHGGFAPCDRETCSGHGECVVTADNSAVCVCDAGFFSDGLECVAWSVDGDADTDADGALDGDLDADGDVNGDADEDPDRAADADPDDPCIPSCDGLSCGGDGCGGSCACASASALCREEECCEPLCADRDCGDDGCGGSCGTCADAMNCTAAFACVPCGGHLQPCCASGQACVFPFVCAVGMCGP